MVIEVDEGNKETTQSSDSVISEAANICIALSRFWDEVSDCTEEDEGKFLNKIFVDMLAGNDTGEEQESILNHWSDDQPSEMQPLALMQASFTSCAYAAQAMNELNNNKLSQAWRSISRSNYWLGVIIGTWSLRKDQPESIKDVAKRGAAARHLENRSMKIDVFKWAEENMANFKSIDSAAEAIAGSLVPVKFRTARGWIGEWKKLRSAGKM